MTFDVYAYAGEATPSTVIADINPRPGASSGVFVSHLVFLTVAVLIQVSQIEFNPFGYQNLGFWFLNKQRRRL